MRRFSRKRIFAIFLGFIGVILVLTVWSHAGAPETRVLFSPFMRLFSKIGPTADDSELQKLVQSLAIERSKYEMLRQEHDDLQTLMGYAKTQDQKFIAARVIGRAKDPFQKSIFIDQGKNDGITLQAPVVMGEGILIGTVAQIWDESALVLLINDQQSKIPAKVLDRDGSLGMLEGHGVLFQLTLVPRDTVVAPGDMVVTAQFGTHIPPGLVIGVISDVQESDDYPFKKIFVTPLATSEGVSFVGVLSPTYGPSL